MTIDRSLRIRRGSMGNRNVLTRIERLKKLAEMDRWEEGDSVFGLAKAVSYTHLTLPTICSV